jgi:dihydrofolate reductase
VAIASLDGYIEDEQGTFGWAEPDEEVHSFVNDLERSVGTYLYGRGMYETMVAWESFALEGQPSHIRDFAEIWREADKIVYSTTLERVSTAKTRLERHFDPDAVSELKATAAQDLAIGGAGLGATAFAAGLVDELHLFLAPVVVGGGKPALPRGLQSKLDLQDERSFGGGFVFLSYRMLG